MCATLTHELDVRGLPPPEPFERIIVALQALPAGDFLHVHIHREPYPLYKVLLDGGYSWQTTELDDGSFSIRINYSE
ncbi:MAG: DUF2249 domain-containing protein [Gallionella sp.]